MLLTIFLATTVAVSGLGYYVPEKYQIHAKLLVYEGTTPISRDRHPGWGLDAPDKRYGFARKVNSVPVTAIEIPLAAREYSIVFAGESGAIMPAVMVVGETSCEIATSKYAS